MGYKMSDVKESLSTTLKLILLHVLVVTCFVNSCDACGVITHIEISHRAKTFFRDDSGSSVDYAKLIQTHNDALMAGSPYPDSYYSDICAGGKYHDVSEDTHWAPFLNATVNYINDKYPKPWDEATEKLVVFTFGIVSHQVADILWHSLGIEQGFLQSMANVNFYGEFSKAHPVGDFGGDVLTDYEMDTSYIPLDQGWYIPMDDLYFIYNNYNGTTNQIPKDVIVGCSVLSFLARYIPIEDLYQIYTNYYNGDSSKMPESIIQDCSLTLFLARLAEALAAKELFRDYANQSPFLVDQLEKFFIGGVDDMAGWTNRIWQETITMFEKGTRVCDIPKSTLFLHCNSSSKLTGYKDPGKNGFFIQPSLYGVTHDDVIVTRELRGIRIKPSPLYMEKLKNKMNKSTSLKYKRKNKLQSNQVKQPDHILYVKNDNAKLGESYATGDLNFDGKPDLVVSAPGYGSPGSPQEGRVYIIYGDDNGIPVTLNSDLDTLESTGQGQILKGWGTAQSRFGTSVAVVDINLDGADDIAISGPAFVEIGTSPLQYNGYVLIYFGIPQKKMVANGAANITVACSKVQYCNLGYSMTSGDIDGDGNPDLIIGSPFNPSHGEQQGLVVGLFASKLNTGYQYIEVGALKWGIRGDQDDAWFGYNLEFGKWNDNNVLFVSQPEYRKCYNKNCTHTESDVQAIGRIHGFYGKNLTKNWTVEGTQSFGQLGWNAHIGNPYPNKSHQVIAVSVPGMNVDGTIGSNDYTFQQGGQVYLYNSTSGSLPSSTKKPLIVLEGDRDYGRYGEHVKNEKLNKSQLTYHDFTPTDLTAQCWNHYDKTSYMYHNFWDINNDGMDDLFVTAPLRSDDVTEEIFGAEQGYVYVYTGGEHFPTLPSCGNSLIKPCPAYQASYVLQWSGRESKMKFGSNLAHLKSKNSNQVFVTAQHNSDFARLSGAIGVFNF